MLRLRQTSVSLPAPPPGVALAGYASRRTLTDADGQLSAELILLSDADSNEILLGSIDTLFVSPRLLNDLRTIAGVQNLLLFSTHTHSAPSLAPELPLLGEVDGEWYRQSVATLGAALTKLRASPALEVAMAYGEVATELNVNRRRYGFVLDYPGLLKGRFSFAKLTSLAPNRRGTVDPRVRMFTFENGGSTLAIVWSFAAHPAFYPRSRTVSADFPGMVREQLRRVHGDDCTIVYLPGLAGSVMPRLRQRWVMRPSELLMRLLPFWPMLPSCSKRGYKDWVSRVGDAVGAAYAIRRPIAASTPLSFRNASIPDIFLDARTQRSLALNASYVRFGDACGILAYSGEMLAEWANHLKGSWLNRTIVSGYAGGDCLYVPTTEQLHYGGYEVDGFQPFFSLGGQFREDITNQVISSTQRLVGNGQEA